MTIAHKHRFDYGNVRGYPSAGGLAYDRDSAGWQKRGNILVKRPAGELRRFHRVTANDGQTYRTTLLEGGRTNELTRSEEFDHADWTKLNVTITADDATAPDGAATADKITFDSDGGRALQAGIVGSSGAEAAWSLHVKRSNFDWGIMRVMEVGASTNQFRAWFNLSTEAVGATASFGNGSFTRAYFEESDLGNDWLRIVIVGSISGTTSYECWFDSASADGSTTGAVGDVAWIWGAQLEEGAFATSYIQTTTAAASRDADLLQTTPGFTPEDIENANGLTVLSEWVELGAAFTSLASRFWQIGGSGAASTPYLRLRRRNDGDYFADFDDGSGNVESGTNADVISLFDHVRARVVIFLDGSDWKIQLHVSVNGAAEVSATAATIGSSLPASWSADTLTIGAAPDDTLHGFAGHMRFVAWLGAEKSLEEMMAL